MQDCLFCKIISKEIPTKFTYQDKDIVAFPDINPKAPVHILIVPREHIDSVAVLPEDRQILAGKMFIVAQKVAEKFGISKSGYRLIVNCRRNAGQLVDHLHMHLLGGKYLGPEVCDKG